MVQLLAHITANEVPSFWLTAMASFAAGLTAGVAVTYGLMARKIK